METSVAEAFFAFVSSKCDVVCVLVGVLCCVATFSGSRRWTEDLVVLVRPNVRRFWLVVVETLEYGTASRDGSWCNWLAVVLMGLSTSCLWGGRFWHRCCRCSCFLDGLEPLL